MNKSLFLLGILIVLATSMVSANLLIDNSAQQNPTFIGESKIFYLSLFNNGTTTLKNITFSPIQKYVFPVVGDMLPGQNTSVPYSVLNNEISSGVFVSTISYFFDSTYNVTSKQFVESIYDSGFSSCNLTLMQNDSVMWINNRSSNSEVKSLSSGWSNLLLSPLGFQSVIYPTVGSWVFYVDSLPACTLNVLPYNNIVLSHDSFNDVPVSFSLHTVVNPSNLVLNALQSNFSSYNNQTQVGVLEVKNNGNYPLYNVILNDSKGWLNFSQQNFTMDALSNRLITFNLTPFIFWTNQSNISHIITIFGLSSNGGNVSRDISLFIPYTNLDNSSYSNTYNVNFLSINATARACSDNRIGLGQYKPGFEECIKLEVIKNNTVIRDVPAVATMTEAQVKAIGDSASKTDVLVQNNINAQGVTQDYMNNISSKYDSTITFMEAEYHKTLLWMDFTDQQIRDNIRGRRIFWITFSALIILTLVLVSLYFSWKYVWAKKIFQYNL